MLSLAEIYPELVHLRGPLAYPGANPASINLCPGLQARLCARGTLITMADLFPFHITVRAAWSIAAENLLARAAAAEGVIVPHRRVPGIEAIEVGLTHRWLAHPLTFTVVHRQSSSVLGCSPIYLTPAPDCLYAVSPRHYPQLVNILGPGADARPMYYHHGFPWIGQEPYHSATATPQALPGVSEPTPHRSR